MGWSRECPGGSLHLGSVSVPRPCHCLSLFPYLWVSALSWVSFNSSLNNTPTSLPLPVLQVALKPERLQRCQGPRPPWLRRPRPCSWAIAEDLTGLGPSLPGDGAPTGCAPAVGCLGWLSGPDPAWEPRAWALPAIWEVLPFIPTSQALAAYSHLWK